MTRRLVFLIASLILVLATIAMLVSWWLIDSPARRPTPTVVGSVANTNPTFDAGAAKQTLAARRTDTPIVVGSPAPGSIIYSTPELTPAATPLPAYVSPTPETRMFSNPQKDRIVSQLDSAWTGYKTRFIESSGRVLDPLADNITTSEGQSYALLRAVWQNDRATFDKVLSWTLDNLKTPNSGALFAYKWGKDSSTNTWKTLDTATASDADSDIALALVFASRLWGDPKYATLTQAVITDIWNYEVVQVQGVPYLTAGDWATTKTSLPLNPSYLSPASMRIFANLDPAHDWKELVDSSYKVIQGCTEANLDVETSAKLPPNWCGLNRQSGHFTLSQDYPRLDTGYGYDAFRTMWRVALDYSWFGDKRALDYLTASDALRTKYKQTGKLFAVYDHAGNPLQTQEDLAIYGGDLANFWLTDPLSAIDIVDRKLLPTYNESGNQVGWGDLQNYYSQNWVWFGLALYAGKLPNYAAAPTASAGQMLTPAALPNPTATASAGLGR